MVKPNYFRVSMVIAAAALAASLLVLFAVPKQAQAAFPGKNGKIAFARPGDNANLDIFVVNPDGTDQTKLTSSAGDDRNPAVSPDGTKIAFTSNRDGTESTHDIFVMNADGSDQVNLTENATRTDGTSGGPTWSPDGTKIAFTGNRDGNIDIYVMNADGSNHTQLTNDFDSEPAWSPVGNKIAFTRSVDNNREVYVMDADGSNHTRLTNEPADDVGPAWSPDDAKIAFKSGRDGTDEFAKDIFVMNANGSNQANLTNDSTALTSTTGDGPAWSPDGTKIAFGKDTPDGPTAIYVMNTDGSDQTRLTNDVNSFFELEPNWGVDPPPTVVSVKPTDGAKGVRRAANVTATFSEAVDPDTLNGNVTLAKGSTSVGATVTVSSDGKTVTLDPSEKLASRTKYTATVKGGSLGVKDKAGNPLAANKVWSFTTGFF